MATLSCNELPKNETLPTLVLAATSILITTGGAAACGTCRASGSARCTCRARGTGAGVAVVVHSAGSSVIAVCIGIGIGVASVATPVRYCELVAVILSASLCQL